MAKYKPKTVPYRRKREKKTDYAKRLKLLLSRKPRIVVRFTNQRIIAQIISFDTAGDKVLAAVNSFALKEYGWKHSCKSFPAAYLTGLLLGRKAFGKALKAGVLDTGLRSAIPKGKIYAFLKGVLDGGLDVPHGDDMFPTEERIKGQHINDDVSASFAKIKQKINEITNKNDSA